MAAAAVCHLLCPCLNPQGHAALHCWSCCSAALRRLLAPACAPRRVCGLACLAAHPLLTALAGRFKHARAMQSLVDNELRDRVTLRVDGGMRSGRDVLVSAALGGDEFGFGTVRIRSLRQRVAALAAAQRSSCLGLLAAMHQTPVHQPDSGGLLPMCTAACIETQWQRGPAACDAPTRWPG